MQCFEMILVKVEYELDIEFWKYDENEKNVCGLEWVYDVLLITTLCKWLQTVAASFYKKP